MNSNLVGIQLYKVSSKQNERWATQVQPTEPLVRSKSDWSKISHHLFCPVGVVVHLLSISYISLEPFLAHLTQRVMWAIVTTERPSSVVRPSVRPSVNFSHFNQLLWNHWANLNQTLVEWSLDGPLPKLCSVIPTSNQDGRQAKNRKKGGMKF